MGRLNQLGGFEPRETALAAIAKEAGKDHDFDLEEIWDAVDANGDGALSKKEIFKAVRGYAKEHDEKLPKGWKKEVGKLFKHVDANKDGKITPEEAKAAVFEAVDGGEKDGEWSKDEVKDGIKAAADHMDVKLKDGWEADVDKAFDAVDKDKSGKVSPKEVEDAIKEHGYPDFEKLAAKDGGEKTAKKGGKGKKGGKVKKDEGSDSEGEHSDEED